MSSKPVLYYTPRSPPCRAVLLTAAALGVELDLRLVDTIVVNFSYLNNVTNNN